MDGIWLSGVFGFRRNCGINELSAYILAARSTAAITDSPSPF
jgi:hypothetical protein